MMDFAATSLYPSVMWDQKSVHPKMESGFVFKPDMNDVFVKAFNDQTFNHDGDDTAILKTKCYNPPNRIFQHLPVTVKDNVENIEFNRVRKGYIFNTLT